LYTGQLFYCNEDIFHSFIACDNCEHVSAISPDGEEISKTVSQMLSCAISGLSAPAKIKWIKPDGTEVSKDDSTNYVLDDGRDGFVKEGGLQTTTLTLKVPVVEKIRFDATYKCSVQSGKFSKAPAFPTEVPVGT
jgi:hypothetical protein